MISTALSLCGPVERCLRIARWRVAVGWCQGAYVLEYNGTPSFCAAGACGENDDDAVPSHLLSTKAMLREVTGCQRQGLAEWNDAPERTQAEVVAAFDKAIELARVRGV